MNFKPLHDRIAIKAHAGEEKTAGGIIIPDTAKEKPLKGEVIAVGNGHKNENGSVTPLEIKVGDVIMYSQYGGTSIKINGKEPAVIVGRIKNLSHEHINTNTFIADIERELINSGNVQFVASQSARDEIRMERDDQAANATAETRNEMGQEYGADFMMQGQINTIIDIVDNTQVRFYQVNLELVSIKDNRKVWIGEMKIKKLVKNSKLRE